MCGICGAVQFDGQPITPALLRKLNNTLEHRGPDGEGLFCVDNVGLAMRRLSIIDLAGSDQPLYNEDKSIALVFNGEIFNYREVRNNLLQQGHRFHTDGDGETIAHLYEEYGSDAPNYLRGQFAFALWDSREKRLFLARDRYGQKPLYYYHDRNVFVFGSEIKAILEHPSVPCTSVFDDPQNLAIYLGYGYIPAPNTAFKHIKMLEAGKSILLDCRDGGSEALPQSQYWAIPAISDQHAKPSADIQPYIEGVRDHLREAVELRMIADVPLGAFLSGGLDSSLIVALMQQLTNQQVQTFSIGFEGDDSFDETPYAKEVADYLQTNHRPFIVKPDAMNLLEKLVWHHDQPFADSSAIPTFLVSELTRQHVTVALTGDGGDELFAGYERFYAASLVQKIAIVPRPVWQMTAAIVNLLPEGTGYYNTIKRGKRFVNAASKPLEAAYFDWVRVLNDNQTSKLISVDRHFYDTAALDFQHTFDKHSPKNVTIANILHMNQRTYLPDDLLIKADRCSMAASLEARAPFLDHKLAEYAATIPLNLKLKGSTTKHILKEAAKGLLPEHIIHRKKHGFGVPLGAWLRHDISPVNDILLSHTARQRNLLHTPTVERLISEHRVGTHDHNRQLWALLTLEQWHRTFID